MKGILKFLTLFCTVIAAAICCTKGPSEIEVSSISLDKKDVSLKLGETVTLAATINPADATDKTVAWSTSDAAVATVDNGVVKAVKVGSTTITAKAGDKTATCAITVVPTEVESITLDKTEATLKAGETVTLTATVYPASATDKSVVWSSSDASVATVDNGVVKTIKVGSATITAKAGDKAAICNIVVTPTEVGSVSLDKAQASLRVGESVTLTATITPADATDKTVTWSTSDAAVATVDNGVVKAIKQGTATITAKAGSKTATCVISVVPTEVESVTLDKTAASLKAGETVTLTATINPADATDKTVTWSSSDAAVATVDNGVVKAVKVGSATITAKAGSKTATCAITVVPTEVESISLDKTEVSLKAGETVTLTATINPADATDKTVTWSTSDASVATVNNGVVKAVKVGSATITAKTVNGGYTASCEVTVPGIRLSSSSIEIMIDNQVQIVAECIPSMMNLVWKSSNSSVATVANDGLVIALSKGSSVITVSSEDGQYSASCTVTVKSITDYIVYSCYSLDVGSGYFSNGVLGRGVKIGWGIGNTGPIPITVTGLEVLYGNSPVVYNISPVEVNPNERLVYTITIIAEVYQPAVRFTYVAAGKEYVGTYRFTGTIGGWWPSITGLPTTQQTNSQEKKHQILSVDHEKLY